MNRIGLFPGSFDPLTNGHVDTVERAAKLFDKVIVAVATNTTKKALFSSGEKMQLINEALQHVPTVEVIEHTGGLTVDLAGEVGASALIRGLRTVKDFEYEASIAAMNRSQHAEIETIFLVASEQYRFLSSSMIKEVAMFGGNVSTLVPSNVNKAIIEKFK